MALSESLFDKDDDEEDIDDNLASCVGDNDCIAYFRGESAATFSELGAWYFDGVDVRELEFFAKAVDSMAKLASFNSFSRDIIDSFFIFNCLCSSLSCLDKALIFLIASVSFTRLSEMNHHYRSDRMQCTDKKALER